MSNNNVNYGILLKLIREKLGLSQSELAMRLGVSQSKLSRYENGEREFKLTFPQVRLIIELLMGCGYSITEALELCENESLQKT